MSLLADGIQQLDLSLVQTALQSGEDPNALLENESSPRRPIFACIWRGFWAGADFLLRHGADPGLRAYGTSGPTFPFFLPEAVANGLIDFEPAMDYLSALQVSCNRDLLRAKVDGVTLLAYFLMRQPIDDDDDECFDILDKMIEYGCDPIALNDDGSSLLFCINSYAPRIVSYLIQLGVDVNAGDGTCTPLHRLVRVHDSDDHGLEALLNAGADPNVKDKQGRAPIDFLIYPFQRVWADQLMKYGAVPTDFFLQKAVPHDNEEAVRWYRLAVEQGSPIAQYKLAEMYNEGIGVSEDKEEAARLFRLAADQGNAEAQFNLGLMYLNGANKDKDSFESKLLGWLPYNGKGVYRDVEEAIRLLELAAKQGNSDAQYTLGWIYHEDNVYRDVEESIRWFEHAAKQGISDAQYALGLIHEQERGISQRDNSAVFWYRLAAEQGHLKAQNKLYDIYFYGRGVPKDEEEAIRWLRLAAEQGDIEAKLICDIFFGGLSGKSV